MPANITPDILFKANTHRLSQLRIRQLRLLVWLSDGLTLSAAAAQLHITAAAASLMLQELESSVGAVLFTRDRRGAQPTEAGLKLAQRSAVVLREFEQFEMSVHTLSTEPLTMKLGVIPQAMIERVPAIASRLARQYPGSLHVSEGTSQALVEAVKSGTLTAAITRMGQVPDARNQWDGLHIDLLGTEQAAMAVPTSHALARKRRITAQELAQLSWVLPEPGSYIRNLLEQHFQFHRLGTPHMALQAGTTVQALWCASRMGLAAAGPLSLIKRFASDWGLKALPLALGEPMQLGLFYRPSQLALPQFMALREAILAA
ncbi:LysR family transcriptional regulator [Variovorax sp. PCZ-1]|uniref:LysR family transcriptional regulator n=1 Tax=Variovorax sp. PCZ-1 TaxID=2835533 RepID=UPI001BD14AE0|nr:LysR family transcriptional regulator [Variovorax sp. PCZ-1]MBS7806307.1 LysR family transcriptional regulator [Variovorax sp. PCZ-1]